MQGCIGQPGLQFSLAQMSGGIYSLDQNRPSGIFTVQGCIGQPGLQLSLAQKSGGICSLDQSVALRHAINCQMRNITLGGPALPSRAATLFHNFSVKTHELWPWKRVAASGQTENGSFQPSSGKHGHHHAVGRPPPPPFVKRMDFNSSGEA